MNYRCQKNKKQVSARGFIASPYVHSDVNRADTPFRGVFRARSSEAKLCYYRAFHILLSHFDVIF